MTSYMRKSISMGFYTPRDATQNFNNWAGDFLDTNTGYVKIWVGWDRLAPYPPNSDGSTVSPAADARCYDFNMQDPNYTYCTDPNLPTVFEYVAGLDAQVKYARQLGLKIVLTFDNFPWWTNNIQSKRTPPADLSTTSRWYQYATWVALRWSAQNPENNGAYADFFEVCNEPNGYAGFTGAAPADVAGRMMVSAQDIQVRWNLSTPIFAEPGTSDFNYVSYTYDLMDYLRTHGFAAANGFGNERWAWSHHNYADIQRSAGEPVRAQDVRRIIEATGGGGGWKGWPYNSPTNPYVLLTEGGTTIGTPAERAAWVSAGYHNVHNDYVLRPGPGDKPGGQGIAMFTQYLDVSDPNHDSGLRDCSEPFAQRPIYQYWKTLPQP